MEIRDNRAKEWFWLDNEYLNGYAKHLGVMCTSVYISLCRHSDNKTQTCFPSMETIAEEIGAGRNAVSRAIKTLEEWGIVSVEEQFDAKNKKRKNNIYTLLSKVNWKEKPCTDLTHGLPMHSKSEKPCTFGDESHAPQECSNKTHINNTQVTTLCEPSSRDYIAEVIKEFESINSAASRFYGNTTQRDAVTKLIEIHTFERVIQIIQKLLPKTNVAYGAPNITTPLQLLERYAALENFVKKNQNKASQDQRKANPVVNVVNGVPIKMYQSS